MHKTRINTELYIGERGTMSLPRPPTSVKYFFGRISRDEAETELNQRGCSEGLYLLRESMTTAGNYALSICHQGRSVLHSASDFHPRLCSSEPTGVCSRDLLLLPTQTGWRLKQFLASQCWSSPYLLAAGTLQESEGSQSANVIHDVCTAD